MHRAAARRRPARRRARRPRSRRATARERARAAPRRARGRPAPSRTLREESASPSASRTVGTTSMRTGRSRSRTIRRRTATCCASFWPKNATSGATMLNSLQTTVQTPSKCAGAALGALEHAAQARHADPRREPVGVDLLRPAGRTARRRRAPRPSRRRTPRCAGRRRGRSASSNWVGLTNSETTTSSQAVARGPHQRLVAGVERAHRRHEPDAAAGAARRGDVGAHLGDRPQRPHARRLPGELARGGGERVEQREQVGRALLDRGALARDRRLVAARDRPGERVGGAEPRPVVDRGAHERRRAARGRRPRSRRAARPRPRA